MKLLKVTQRQWEIYQWVYTIAFIDADEILIVESANMLWADHEIKSVIIFTNGKKIKVCEDRLELEDRINNL